MLVDVKDVAVIDRILEPHRAGLPAVILHCGMHSYRSEGYPNKVTPWFEFTGLQSTGHGAQLPISIEYVSGASPILSGLSNWTTINEELYNNSAGKLLDTATALARGKQTAKNRKGEERIDDFAVVWTNKLSGEDESLCHDPGTQQRDRRGWSLLGLDRARIVVDNRQAGQRLFEVGPTES